MGPLDPSQGIALITDGSANYKDRTGGWAWIALDAFTGIEVDSGYYGNTTISRMELCGPAKGLQHLHEVYGACEVLVFSDSQYVVLGAMDKNRKRHKNKAQWKWLDEAIALHLYVEFHHVKGHAGHEYNELADKMAGQARKSKGVK